ncbi:stage V sporulation protein AC [Proteiniborus ethanoligenes]|uniref:Stage V sporulation protein AC n=1 Tax=Proteiniborus ethanoligenes TaxID=415015 RepID=A0A1H3QRZ7_9FIRM|nr:stage V sporulation protein AC [Proteiniborus ethanoligenes]TAH63687.1 MAG: stage V sporulation protein AC [Gottschalkiaceae bacterium]SDZ15489.1 stage V sporulation protein AC [Proteiniborus ethanoligenes]
MDNINKKDYYEYVKKKMPKPNYLRNCIWAFIVGGLISDIGQLITSYFKSAGLDKKSVSAATAIVLVFIGSFLTGLGLYDRLGKKAGAGSIVPITGFANAIVSPAMEYKREGFVLGVASKMFIIAGPVLVYGYGSSIIIGIIYLLLKK